jgi:hypothetical protein
MSSDGNRSHELFSDGDHGLTPPAPAPKENTPLSADRGEVAIITPLPASTREVAALEATIQALRDQLAQLELQAASEASSRSSVGHDNGNLKSTTTTTTPSPSPVLFWQLPSEQQNHLFGIRDARFRPLLTSVSILVSRVSADEIWVWMHDVCEGRNEESFHNLPHSPLDELICRNIYYMLCELWAKCTGHYDDICLSNDIGGLVGQERETYMWSALQWIVMAEYPDLRVDEFPVLPANNLCSHNKSDLWMGIPWPASASASITGTDQADMPMVLDICHSSLVQVVTHHDALPVQDESVSAAMVNGSRCAHADPERAASAPATAVTVPEAADMTARMQVTCSSTAPTGASGTTPVTAPVAMTAPSLVVAAPESVPVTIRATQPTVCVAEPEDRSAVVVGITPRPVGASPTRTVLPALAVEAPLAGNRLPAPVETPVQVPLATPVLPQGMQAMPVTVLQEVVLPRRDQPSLPVDPLPPEKATAVPLATVSPCDAPLLCTLAPVTSQTMLLCTQTRCQWRGCVCSVPIIDENKEGIGDTQLRRDVMSVVCVHHLFAHDSQRIIWGVILVVEVTLLQSVGTRWQQLEQLAREKRTSARSCHAQLLPPSTSNCCGDVSSSPQLWSAVSEADIWHAERHGVFSTGIDTTRVRVWHTYWIIIYGMLITASTTTPGIQPHKGRQCHLRLLICLLACQCDDSTAEITCIMLTVPSLEATDDDGLAGVRNFVSSAATAMSSFLYRCASLFS